MKATKYFASPYVVCHIHILCKTPILCACLNRDKWSYISFAYNFFKPKIPLWPNRWCQTSTLVWLLKQVMSYLINSFKDSNSLCKIPNLIQLYCFVHKVSVFFEANFITLICQIVNIQQMLSQSFHVQNIMHAFSNVVLKLEKKLFLSFQWKA